MSGNTAWVTLATNDTYCLGALVLANSLKRVNTVHQLAVLITPGVSQPMRQQLAKVFNVVKEVDVLDSGDEANLALIARPELGVTFTKLHCWNLTQFSKCVFLDADILVVQNCDELFEREELSAAPDVGWPDCFNSGVFVFVPSKDTFKALIDCALSQGSFDGGDQGLLNIFFKDWPTKDIKKHLPFIYNMVSTASYSYLPAFKLFGSQVKIVHFIGSNKPWLQSGSATTSTLSGFLETWWNIFNSHVSQTLSTEMISNYSFDDVRWQKHSSFTQSPIPVHHHSYEQFRGVNMVQEQPQEEERHQFADPWEEITLEHVQSTTRGHCAQSSLEAGCTNYLSERKDNCICLSTEESSDLVQRIGEIRLTAEDQNNTEPINGYCRNQSVPSCVDVSIPALGMRNISEQMSIVNTHNETQSEKQMYNTKQITNFSNDISSNTEQLQQQDSYHIPSTSIHSSMPPLSSSQLPSLPVDMHSNNSPQTCFLLQQESTSNGGFHQEAGLAGALAGGERGPIEDVWRRQNWEQGVIDYMGRDSFDNIWKKISESIGSKAAVPATAPVVAAPSTEAGEKSSAPLAATAETKETPSQQGAKEPTDSAVPPPVKAEQLEGAPIAVEQQTADKTATPLGKKDEAPKTEIPKSELAKEDPSSKSEKVDVALQAKVSPSTDAEASKEKAQDLPKSDTPTTPTKPVQPSEITPQKEEEQPKTEIPIQPLPAVPLPPPEAKTETPTDIKPTQEAKSDVVPTETKDTEEKTSSDKAGKEIIEAAVSKQEVPKAETTPPTECSKPDTAQPVKEAKSAEEKTDKPEAKESVPSDVHKTEEVKTPPVEVKTTQEVPKETLAATEKPAKDDSAPKEHSSQAAPKETPPGIETAVKEDSAPKVPSLSETPKEALSGPKTPVKDDSVPKIPSSPGALTETVAAPTCTPASPTGTPPAPTETPLVSTVTPATPSTPASAEKPVKDAASKVPSSPTAPKELPAGIEQPKKDDTAPKEPSSSAESKEASKKDDSAPKVPTEPAAVSKDVAPASGVPAEVPPPTATPSGPEVPSEAKPAAESKKAPPTSAPSTPQASPAEGASAAAAAPVPPKRKGNKEQKSGNGGKQSKSKK